MKKLGLFIFMAFQAGIAFSQCSGKLLELAAARSGTDALFIRDFPVKLEEGTFKKPSPVARFQVLLNEGIHYRFNLANAEGFEGKAIMQLYDRTNLLGSTFDLDTKTDLQSFEYECAKTGTYQVLMSFLEGEKGCAVGIMSLIISDSLYFVRQKQHQQELENLYIGMKNELTIAATDIPGGTLEVSISQGTITGSNGMYIAEVDREGIARIKVIARDRNGNISEIDSIDFLACRIPLPEVLLNGKQGGFIFRSEVDHLVSLSLKYSIDIKGAPYDIAEFTIASSKDDLSGLKSLSGVLTNAQLLFIRKLGSGEQFTIKNIILRAEDGTMHLAKPMLFYIE